MVLAILLKCSFDHNSVFIVLPCTGRKLKFHSVNMAHVMKMYGGVKVNVHAFLKSSLDGGEWSLQLSTAFLLIHWTGQRVEYRAE